LTVPELLWLYWWDTMLANRGVELPMIRALRSNGIWPDPPALDW